MGIDLVALQRFVKALRFPRVGGDNQACAAFCAAQAPFDVTLAETRRADLAPAFGAAQDVAVGFGYLVRQLAVAYPLAPYDER